MQLSSHTKGAAERTCRVSRYRQGGCKQIGTEAVARRSSLGAFVAGAALAVRA